MNDIDLSPMSPLARANLSFALKRIAEAQQTVIAVELGVSESTVSRFISGDLTRLCGVLAAIGIKLVSAESEMYEPRKVQILLELAREHLNGLDKVEPLEAD